MLTLKTLMNPNLTDKETALALPENLCVKELNLTEIAEAGSKYINVIDQKGKVLGSIKREQLLYLAQKQREIPFTEILDALDVGIQVIDADCRIYYVNEAYGSIVGVDIGKILGRYLNVIEPDAALLKVLVTGQSKVIDVQLIKSVGKYVSTRIQPVYRNGVLAGAYSVFTDVTDVNLLHDEVRRMSEVTEEFHQQMQARNCLKENHVIGKDKLFLECVNKVLKVAVTDANLLLRGENGAGKEVMVNLIKNQGSRKDKPFVAVNCSAIPETLIESELFGYEGGTFTGASKEGKLGKFQLADGGTLFLDEIGDMPYAMQAKLLRVLQEGEIEKVGRKENIPIDVRVIAATNRPLEEMVREGTFREDLYYRLDVISIEVPPLRERGNDVLLLADYFMSKYCSKYGKTVTADKGLYRFFLEYNWPGNVRELQNAVESAVVLCDGDIIHIEDLPERIGKAYYTSANERTERICTACEDMKTLKEEVEIFEKKLIISALQKYRGNKRAVMEHLGLTERTLYRKIAIYGIKTK